MVDAPDAGIDRAEGARPGLLEPVAAWLDRVPAIGVGLGLMALALAAYWLPGTDRFYNHFVWQAEAFLHGTAVIDWPVQPSATSAGNAYFQDVYPMRVLTGDPSTPGALLPFPPLPAVVLMPFVAIWGLATDHRAVSVALGAIDVGIAWWALGRLRVSRRIRLATTVFFAFGTVFWYAAQLGTTWFFAHVVAVTFALLAVGLALGGDPEADAVDSPPGPTLADELREAFRAPLATIDRRQLAAGLLFGLACTARLTVVFAAPFLVFVGSGGSWVRRAVSAGIGTAIPVAALLAYNVATTGHVFHPGYEYQYEIEASGYPSLDYHPDWAIEDIRYLPQNLAIFLAEPPMLLPDTTPSSVAPQPVCTDPGAQRGLFDKACPLATPRDVGLSILLTSPAYLLAIPALRGRRSRLVIGATLAVGAIAVVNLMHFSQGWVQFGYRFSNDFVPFALPLIAVGMARRQGVGLLGAGLIGVSVVVNLWGVIWGNVLGW